jgi:hypothetical protein
MTTLNFCPCPCPCPEKETQKRTLLTLEIYP